MKIIAEGGAGPIGAEGGAGFFFVRPWASLFFFGRGDVPLLMWMHTQGSVLAANAALVCEKVQDWET